MWNMYWYWYLWLATWIYIYMIIMEWNDVAAIIVGRFLRTWDFPYICDWFIKSVQAYKHMIPNYMYLSQLMMVFILCNTDENNEQLNVQVHMVQKAHWLDCGKCRIHAITPPTKSFRSLAPVRIARKASNSKCDLSPTKSRRMLKFHVIVCDKSHQKITLSSKTNNEIYIYLLHNPTV